MVHNRIRALREERGMTQVRLSIELEVAQETVSAYETDKHCPSVPTLIRLSGLFDASIDYILGLSEVRRPLETVPGNQEIRLLTQFRHLTSVQKERALAYMQGLLDG